MDSLMNFTLTYDGNLKANGSREHKQEIRHVFHGQLYELWKHSSVKPSESLIKKIGNYSFFPLVVEGREEFVELEILMLRPDYGPGYVVQGGDIDNRLKTLFDSLRIPKDINEIPSDTKKEEPFYCLFEDDILISKLSINTDRLLEPEKSNPYVKLIIHVQVNRSPLLGGNMMLTLG
jgi:hypothetical protein